MGHNKYQYLATFCVNLLMLGFGAACGWPSAGNLLLMSDESPLPRGRITMNEASWISSLLCLGGLTGNILYAWVTERFGRKYPLLLLAVPQILSWFIIIYATEVFHLYIARFLAGFTNGAILVVLPSFVAEISEDKIRGILGSCTMLTCNVGMLLVFLLGNYASYEFTPIVFIVISILFICTFSLFPESPQFLIKQNKEFEAEKSLRFYHGLNHAHSDYELLQIELKKLRSVFGDETKKGEAQTKLSIKDFKSREARKSMIIAFALVALNQLCGCFAMLNYTATIFADAGSNLTPNMSAIVVGAIQLFGVFISLILVDRAGRKFLIAVSAVGIAIGQTMFGIYIMLKTHGYDVSSYGWVPLVSFSFTLFLAYWGVLSLPFVVIAEILPEKIRNFGTSFSNSSLSIFAFIVVKMFPYISETLGMDGSMFMFASISLIGALFVIYFMPETKGLSFEEITELLRK